KFSQPSCCNLPGFLFYRFYRSQRGRRLFRNLLGLILKNRGGPKSYLTKASCCQGNEKGRLSPYLRVGEYRLRPENCEIERGEEGMYGKQQCFNWAERKPSVKINAGQLKRCPQVCGLRRAIDRPVLAVLGVTFALI